MPDIMIVAGSVNDFDHMDNCFTVLNYFRVSYEKHIASAHRTPVKVESLAKNAKQSGVKVIIAVAGMAAALPGVIAAYTRIPVIGVPMEGNMSGGLDAILSMVQMPGGVPVATVALGKQGAKNAALLAIRIMALSDSDLDELLEEYIRKMNAG